MDVSKSDWAKYIAEMVGTMFLTLFGCGVAVFLGCDTPSGVVGTALAFGLSIVAMAYTIVDISGCHINPAVSLGVWMNKKMSTKDFIFYVIFQFIGGIIGAALLYAIIVCTGNGTGVVESLGQNGYEAQSATDISIGGAFLVEVILTAVFVGTVLGVTKTGKTAAQAGIVIGATLTFVHLLGITLTGTSVNPARSFGPALMMLTKSSTAMGQVWLFIVAPLVGAAIAALFYKYVLCANDAKE